MEITFNIITYAKLHINLLKKKKNKNYTRGFN